MGRWQWSNRVTVERCKSIDIRWLLQQRLLKAHTSSSLEWKNSTGEVTSSIGFIASVGDGAITRDHIRLIYSHTSSRTGEKTEVDSRVDLVTTPCHFGGVRYWFICPLIVDGVLCRRRIGKLYLPPRRTYFGCRHCYNLTYRCQKEHDKTADVLRKNPALLMAQVEKGDTKALLAALRVMSIFD